MDFSQTNGIQILGGAGNGGHLIPSDHISFDLPDSGTYPSPYIAIAPADGYLAAIFYQPQRWKSDDGSVILDDYGLLFQYSKNFFLVLGHLTDIAADLKNQFPPLQKGEDNFCKIPVKAGQEIGRYGGCSALHAYDFWTIDMNVNTPYIDPAANPERSQHTVSPLDYFAEPLRSQVVAMLPDRPEPRIGQWVYDIDGKLAGLWYRVKPPLPGNKYLYEDADLLGFFYYNLQPSTVRIGYGGTGHVYEVTGNTPDPVVIDVSSGLVKYELIDPNYEEQLDNLQQMLGTAEEQKKDYIRQEIKDLLAKPKDTMLIQMTEKRKIKLEFFAGKSASEVTGFDENAVYYQR